MTEAKGLIVEEVVRHQLTRFFHFPTGLNVRVAEGVLHVYDDKSFPLAVFAAGQWVNVLKGNAVYWEAGADKGGPIELLESTG